MGTDTLLSLRRMAETMRVMGATGDGVEMSEISKPTPGRGDVRSQVIASAVNTAEAKVIGGDLVGRFLRAKTSPLVLGWDFAGTVDALGDGVTDLDDGTAVWGHLAYSPSTRQGTFAEYVTLPREALAAKPDDVPFHVAAAAPIDVFVLARPPQSRSPTAHIHVKEVQVPVRAAWGRRDDPAAVPMASLAFGGTRGEVLRPPPPQGIHTHNKVGVRTRLEHCIIGETDSHSSPSRRIGASAPTRAFVGGIDSMQTRTLRAPASPRRR